jgi:hypothetical protein
VFIAMDRVALQHAQARRWASSDAALRRMQSPRQEIVGGRSTPHAELDLQGGLKERITDVDPCAAM